MRAAVIRSIGGEVELITVPGPRPLTEDEMLLQVMAAGAGNKPLRGLGRDDADLERGGGAALVDRGAGGLGR